MCFLSFHGQTSIADSRFNTHNFYSLAPNSRGLISNIVTPLCVLVCVLLLFFLYWGMEASVSPWGVDYAERRIAHPEPRALRWLFWILCWQACFLSAARPVVSNAHGWLPRSHAWPQLSGQMLHGWVGCPEPCGATVHLWQRVARQFKREPSPWIHQKPPSVYHTFNTQSRCWKWYLLTAVLSVLFPCWVNHSGIFLLKSALLEKRGMIWAHTFIVLPSWRHPEMSSGFHLFSAISTYNLIVERLEGVQTSVVTYIRHCPYVFECAANVARLGFFWLEEAEVELPGLQRALFLLMSSFSSAMCPVNIFRLNKCLGRLATLWSNTSAAEQQAAQRS